MIKWLARVRARANHRPFYIRAVPRPSRPTFTFLAYLYRSCQGGQWPWLFGHPVIPIIAVVPIIPIVTVVTVVLVHLVVPVVPVILVHLVVPVVPVTAIAPIAPI